MKNLKRILAVALTVILVMTVFTACVKTPEKQILGSWRDSTQTMGYEFKENNAVTITFLDITVPIVNLPYKGTVEGTYQITEREDGNHYVTITYTVFAATITKDYMFTVEESALTLQDTADNTVTVLMAYTAPEEFTVAPTEAATVA